jgi:hypothetical protein
LAKRRPYAKIAEGGGQTGFFKKAQHGAARAQMSALDTAAKGWYALLNC